MKKHLLLWALLLAALPVLRAQNNRNFKIGKNLEVFSDIYKQLDRFYVDSLSADTVINWAISSMLRQVDPFTVYYSEDDMDDLKLMMTNKYAGIGSVIRFHKGEDRVIIAEPYVGSPSYEAGVKAGDIILSIDDDDIKGLDVSEVSNRLRGDAGTSFVLKVKRYGQDEPLSFKITRRNIQMPTVPYFGMVRDGVGYINLNGFTDGSARDVRRALVELKGQGATSLVLDLRGNPGGAMVEAVEIVNLFVPRGSKVLFTKGKTPSSCSEFFAEKAPLDTDIPMVVLVDGGSASAAEIVAGALQDMDRAVVLGMRTYGKGLVQTVREVPYRGSLKVTTSRYYIPSGRCIQAYDYRHLNADGSVGTVPDSLTKVFHTAAGREVRDGGGIKPDVETRPDSLATIVYEIVASDAMMDYVTRYVAGHPTIAPAGKFTLTDEEYADFVKFVSESKFSYKNRSADLLALLEKTARREQLYDEAKVEFESLAKRFSPDVTMELQRNKKDICRYLEDEIIRRYYYQEGGILQQLKDDPDLEKALEVLSDRTAYNKILKK